MKKTPYENIIPYAQSYCHVQRASAAYTNVLKKNPLIKKLPHIRLFFHA